MLYMWMSTEINITIDRHLQHTPWLVSHNTTASTAVLLKLDFETSLDLHIDEQLHRICCRFPHFSFRHCILRHPSIEFYHGIFWTFWHHCKASSLLRATVFLKAKMLVLLCFMLPEHFFLAFFSPLFVILVSAFGWHTKPQTTHLGCQRDLE